MDKEEKNRIVLNIDFDKLKDVEEMELTEENLVKAMKIGILQLRLKPVGIKIVNSKNEELVCLHFDKSYLNNSTEPLKSDKK